MGKQREIKKPNRNSGKGNKTISHKKWKRTNKNKKTNKRLRFWHMNY
jgi:hypothetical protein